jgi:hypothetical protein
VLQYPVRYKEEKMKLHKRLSMLIIVCSILSSVTIASAGDFDWLKDLSIQAQADPSGFKYRLGTRFNIGDVEVNAVISNVPDPADAYMILRLGEMSANPIKYVIEQYNANKNQGWGVLAKSLGIKPGSDDFQTLKRGHDMPNSKVTSQKQDNGKGKNEGKPQGKK